MKSKKNLLEQLKPLPYFNKRAICQLGTQLEIKDATVDTYISRFLKHKEILQLKNGLYVTTDFFEKNRSDVSYAFYLANIVRTPSYISSWAALQYYNLAAEAIYSITSTTTKVTRAYQTKAGNFSYQSIRRDLFTDFYLINGKFNFYIASPAKALFDLLYFRTSQLKGVGMGDIKKMIKELRIDFDEMDKTEQEKFFFLIKNI
ncbi:hypothetical protein KKC67_01565 [Patescibacteria group bacterium]|nr:hypothetical protein [Patescibacteria group bacterium]MBU1062559.1 hypothetical protein [Patescibacteria group bacterium]MBU1991685.1 hypothetical protein [Patescibacteria group bacterium]